MRVSDLRVGYSDTAILEAVSFAIEETGHLSILGPNGSGKSTLAKALCGLLPYKGSIKIGAQELRDIPSKERAKLISYIPAKMESFEQFTTVEDFVLLGRYPYKASFKDYTEKDRIIVQETLQELSLEALGSARLHELSSGQQQLVLIAQALVQQSSILIFDEPTSNLDPKNTALFVHELKRLRQNRMTILISHDIQLAAHLDDPVLFIHEKRAEFHSKGFFENETLSRAYGVAFQKENGMIGIAYA